MKRRNFLKNLALLTGAGILAPKLMMGKEETKEPIFTEHQETFEILIINPTTQNISNVSIGFGGNDPNLVNTNKEFDPNKINFSTSHDYSYPEFLKLVSNLETNRFNLGINIKHVLLQSTNQLNILTPYTLTSQVPRVEHALQMRKVNPIYDPYSSLSQSQTIQNGFVLNKLWDMKFDTIFANSCLKVILVPTGVIFTESQMVNHLKRPDFKTMIDETMKFRNSNPKSNISWF